MMSSLQVGLISFTLVAVLSPVLSWVPTVVGPSRWRDMSRIQRFAEDPSFIDADFEQVDESSSTTVTTTKTTTKKTDGPVHKQDASGDGPKSLLELSLEMDPQWKEARIPFVSREDNRVIDCNLAFCVDLDGVTYGIGVPCDPAVAVTLEEETTKTTTYMNPTEHQELIEVFAVKLQEYLGDDVFLKNTPKILTIGGNLGKYTDNWQENLFPDLVDAETLLNDSGEGMDFFYDFMKKELGEEEFQKTLDECQSEGAVDKDLLELFDVPGLGDQENDVAGIQDMLKSMLDEDQESSFTKIGVDLDHEGVALKLVGFNFSDGKSYTLVKLLKPFTIVGKYVQDEKEIRFDLLTTEEERLLIPRLERVCKKNLEDAGLSLTDD